MLRRYFEQQLADHRGAPADGDRGGVGRATAGARSTSSSGLCGVHVPEAYGGQGFGFVELGIVLEEMGRALVCAPYFASAVLAATAIMNAATEAQKDALLPPHRRRRDDRDARLHRAERALGRGRRRGHGDAGQRRLPARRREELRARRPHRRPRSSCWRARPGSTGEEGLSLFTVRGDAPGLTRTPLQALDPTRKLARLEFAGVEAELMGEAGAAAAPFTRTLVQAAVVPRQRDGRRRRAAARGRARLRQPARAVRPPDRLVPVDEAQAGRHAARGRARQVGRLRCRRRPPPTRPTTCRRSPRSPRPPPRRPICRRPSTRSRSTAASASPGTTTPTSGSSAPRVREVFLGDPTWHRERMMQGVGALIGR